MSVPNAPEAAAPLSQPVTTTTGRGGSRAAWVVAAIASIVALVAVGALVLSGGNGESSAGKAGGVSLSEHGSSTPEEAATFFAEAFADGRLDDAATAFATTSLVDGYSFTAYAERVQALSPFALLPSHDEYHGLNLQRRVGDIGGGLTFLTRSLLMPDIDPGATHQVGESGQMSANEFVAALDPAGFASVTLMQVDVIDNTPGTKYTQNQRQFAAPWGAQDTRTVAVLFNTAQGTAVLGLDVIQYDDTWYVWNMGGAILGTPSNALLPVTPQEYDSMVEHAQALADLT